MSKPVLVIGAGGHAKVLIAALLASGAVIRGAVDADAGLTDGSVLGVRVLGGDDAIDGFAATEVELVNGVGSTGDARGRREVYERFRGRGYRFRTVVHPSCIIAADVELDEGAQLMAGVVIQPGTRIGANVIVNTRASIDHDCTVGAHSHVAPGAILGGGVAIGEGCHIGAGAVVIQNIRIGDAAVVGAGAAVVRDVPAAATAVGVPATVLTDKAKRRA